MLNEPVQLPKKTLWAAAAAIAGVAAGRALHKRRAGGPGRRIRSASAPAEPNQNSVESPDPQVALTRPTSQPTTRRRRWRARLRPFGFYLLGAIAGIVILIWTDSLPSSWKLPAKIAITVVLVGILLADFLLGNAARRLAGNPPMPTESELAKLDAKDRLEAINSTRQSLVQAVSTLAILAGLLATAFGLRYTAASVDAARQAQTTAEQGQITDRYTKAIEQVGSDKPDVRLGGIYALGRIAVDSSRDRETVDDVLSAFVQDHAPQRRAKVSSSPAADIRAALNILSESNPPAGIYVSSLNLSDLSLPSARFAPPSGFVDTNLRHAFLSYISLPSADLSHSDLTNAVLMASNLKGSLCLDTVFRSAVMSGADLSGATIQRANLSGATLVNVKFDMADAQAVNFRGARLLRADLRRAQLTGADFRDADLSGADLRGATGISPDKIKAAARTDVNTKF